MSHINHLYTDPHMLHALMDWPWWQASSPSFSIGSQVLHFWLFTSCSLWWLLQLDDAICSPLFEDEHIYVHTEQQLSLPSHITGSCIPILDTESTVEYSSMYMTCMLQVDLAEHQWLKWGPDISNTTITACIQVVHIYFSLYIACTCIQMCTHTCTHHVNYTPTHTW